MEYLPWRANYGAKVALANQTTVIAQYHADVRLNYNVRDCIAKRNNGSRRVA